MYLTIKIHEGFTQWSLLPHGPDTNVPLQIAQRFSANDHNMFWNYFKINFGF